VNVKDMTAVKGTEIRHRVREHLLLHLIHVTHWYCTKCKGLFVKWYGKRKMKH